MEFMPAGSTLQDAIDKAAKEDKMVFLDCYTSWCGPCKMMANTIFPTKEVGDFMNPKFVSIKIDMEKGEGPTLAKRLEVSAYPTFVIFDKTGKEIGRAVGGSDAERFISRVKECCEVPAGPTLAERFEAGERGREFLLQYFDLLGKQYRRAQLNNVAELLLEGQAETFVNDSALVKVFVTGINTPYHPTFIYFASHPEVVKPVVGDRVYDDKVRSVLTSYPNRFLSKNADGTMTLDKEGFDKFLAHIKDNKLANPLEYELATNLTLSDRNGDWKTYVDVLDTWTTDPTVD
ncbi:MAG: thioredoxin family protein, partial [Duncaniella sp.]|nr:thioredoxin family protein [Duncaniella sp.]